MSEIFNMHRPFIEARISLNEILNGIGYSFDKSTIAELLIDEAYDCFDYRGMDAKGLDAFDWEAVKVAVIEKVARLN